MYLLVPLELFGIVALRPLLPFLHGSVSKVIGCSLDITSGFIMWFLAYVAHSVSLSLLAAPVKIRSTNLLSLHWRPMDSSACLCCSAVMLQA